MTAATVKIGDKIITPTGFTQTVCNITEKSIILESGMNTGTLRRNTKSKMSRKGFDERCASGHYMPEAASVSYSVSGKDCTAYTNCTKEQAEERCEQLNSNPYISHLQPFTIAAA